MLNARDYVQKVTRRILRGRKKPDDPVLGDDGRLHSLGEVEASDTKFAELEAARASRSAPVKGVQK